MFEDISERNARETYCLFAEASGCQYKSSEIRSARAKNLTITIMRLNLSGRKYCAKWNQCAEEEARWFAESTSKGTSATSSGISLILMLWDDHWSLLLSIDLPPCTFCCGSQNKIVSSSFNVGYTSQRSSEPGMNGTSINIWYVSSSSKCRMDASVYKNIFRSSFLSDWISDCIIVRNSIIRGNLQRNGHSAEVLLSARSWRALRIIGVARWCLHL